MANEVKDLDQDARGLLRKHGVRFGQFTIFMPAVLKPAPTRLRLVLSGLWDGLDEFPESPPPGLVTIPNLPEVPVRTYTLSGYRPAGDRAIRIDMLERLADMLRTQDTRAGFEANADMLSITGMTLEQFANLMEGLGYAAEKGERAKARAEAAPVVEAPAAVDHDHPLTEEESVLAAETRAKWEAEQAEKKKAEAEADAASEGAEAPDAEAEAAPAPELEVFYTFRWAPRPRNPRPQAGGDRRPRQDRGNAPQQARAPRAEGEGQGDRPRGKKPQGDFKGKPKGGKPPRGKDDRNDRAKSFSARPPRAEKPIDPDNPFAALAALIKKD